MEVNEMMRLAESVGRDAAEMRDAIGGTDVPRDQPLAGVTASSVTRCRQIADQLAYLSDELTTQLRVYSSSVSRGCRLARLQRASSGTETVESRQSAVPQRPTAVDEFDDEFDDDDDQEWRDDL